MKKTINIYIPQEKMPYPDITLLVNGPYLGTKFAYYSYEDNWFTISGEFFGTTDIKWWMYLSEIESVNND